MATDRPARISRTKNLVLLDGAADWFGFEATLKDVGHAGDDGSETIHDLTVRGSIHAETLEFSDVVGEFRITPYGMCSLTTAVVSRLNGLRIGAGYRRAVLELMGGTNGCSHFLSVCLELSQLHTMLMYTRMREQMPMGPRSDPRWIAMGLDMEPRLENACFSLSETSPVILAGKELRGE